MAFVINWVPTSGQNNNFVTNNTGKIGVISDSSQNLFVSNPYNSPLYICIPSTTFQGGDWSAPTLYDFAQFLATSPLPNGTVKNPSINYNGKPLVGGKFTLNGNPCGNYEYNILPTTTLTQSMVATLFSSTLDISSWIIVRGDLTLGSGVTLIPTVNSNYPTPATNTTPDPNAKRRLFMVVYVTGTLTAGSGNTISMSACGGNSDTLGANISSFDIPVATNLTGPKSPIISASGQSGGIPTGSSTTGVIGTTGTVVSDRFKTGGGGSGYTVLNGTIAPGSGGAGSCFSGGTGGGSIPKNNNFGTSGSNLGGAGGNTSITSGYGGTGNPGGTGTNQGFNGTGGILIIIANTTSLASCIVSANGVNSAGALGGGASGGGIVLQISGGATPAYGTVTTRGGLQNSGSAGAGGDGISGTYSL